MEFISYSRNELWIRSVNLFDAIKYQFLEEKVFGIILPKTKKK